MTCLHNHDQILEFLRKIFLKGFQIYQNYLCALIHVDLFFYLIIMYDTKVKKKKKFSSENMQHIIVLKLG